MITLRDEVEIEAPPERIFDWLCHLDENYLAWHPDHVECRYLSEGPLAEGSVIHCEEYLHGELHKLELQATKVIPNVCLEYKAGPGMRGAFRIEPRGTASLFVATLSFGVDIPLFGWVFDKITCIALSNRIVAFKQHMVEEGRNLKQIIEAGRDW